MGVMVIRGIILYIWLHYWLADTEFQVRLFNW